MKIEKNNEIEIKTQPVQIVENEKQDKEIKEDKPEEISSSKENDSNLEQTSEIDIEDCSYIYDDADNNPLDTYYPNEEEYGEYDSNEDF